MMKRDVLAFAPVHGLACKPKSQSVAALPSGRATAKRMKKRIFGAILGAAALAVFTLGSPPAFSFQTPPSPNFSGMIMSTGNTQLGLDMLNGQQDDAAKNKQAQKAQQPALPASVLTFKTSAATRKHTNQRLIATFAQRDDTAAHKVAKFIKSGQLQQAFARLLQQFGMSSHNIADVMTAYVVMSWETVNNTDATLYPQGIQAVRQRVTQSLLHTPKLADIGDAQKQQFAETLGSMAMIGALARKALVKAGKTAQLHKLQAGVRKATMKLGLDVSKLNLTNKGFVTAH